MDADLFAASVEYERLAQSVYQAILRREGDERIEVQHNTEIRGRSGVAHQVDVTWRFRKAGVEHRVLVECKNYGTAITLEKVRNFFAVLHDIGNCTGVMLTRTGYQSGVIEFAAYYNIGLKLLRKPTDEDWEGRLKKIRGRFDIVGVADSPQKRPTVEIQVGESGDKEELRSAIARGDIVLGPLPEITFVDPDGIPLTDQLRWWLPRQLANDGQPVGGPYTKQLELIDHFVEVEDKRTGSRRIKVSGLNVTYHKDVLGSRELIVNGDRIVEAILKDSSTGEIEHFHGLSEN